jgi:hypothetical protein
MLRCLQGRGSRPCLEHTKQPHHDVTYDASFHVFWHCWSKSQQCWGVAAGHCSPRSCKSHRKRRPEALYMNITHMDAALPTRQRLTNSVFSTPTDRTMMLQMTPASTSSGVAGLKRNDAGEYSGALLAQELPALVLLLLLPPTDTAATEQNGTRDVHGKRAGTKIAGTSRPLDVLLCRVAESCLYWCCCCCHPRTLRV